MLHHAELPPWPDPSGQHYLIRSMALPANSAHWILQYVLPGFDPLLSHLLLKAELILQGSQMSSTLHYVLGQKQHIYQFHVFMNILSESEKTIS